LVLHATLLCFFFWKYSSKRVLNSKGIHPWLDILKILFTTNFIGIVCARSLHYQFYAWYAHSLPFLIYTTPFSYFGVILGFLIEFCWNVFPSTPITSLILLICHVTILLGLWKE
jgi:alpha-1,3-mannosyltransferase